MGTIRGTAASARRWSAVGALLAVLAVLATAAGSTAWAGAASLSFLHPDRLPNITLVPDPSANITPAETPENFLSSEYCSFTNGALDNSATCTDAALDAINYAHGVEGLPAITLPSDWSSLTSAEQLLTIFNLERAAYGLPAIVGLTTTFDQESQTAVADAADPVVVAPSGSVNGGSVWAGGYPNVLAADFGWLYDDGWGGTGGTVNGSCTSATAAGCWGHREIVFTECQAAASPPSSCQYIGGAAEAAYGTAPASFSSFAAVVVSTTGAIPPLDYTYPPPLTATTTVVQVQPSSTTARVAVTYTATVTGSGGTPGGTVRFAVGSSTLCTATLHAGTGSCVASSAAVGTDTVTGTYSGNHVFAPSSGDATLTVTAVPTTVALTSSRNPAPTGVAVTYTATVAPVPRGGTVKFTTSGKGITGCKARPVSTTTGVATCTVTYTVAGTEKIAAAFSGTTQFAASKSSVLHEVVTA